MVLLKNNNNYMDKKTQENKDKAMILLTLSLHALQCNNYERAKEKLNYAYKEIKLIK